MHLGNDFWEMQEDIKYISEDFQELLFACLLRYT